MATQTTKTCASCGGPVTEDTAGVWADMPMFGELPVFCKPCWQREIKLAQVPAKNGTLALDFPENKP